MEFIAEHPLCVLQALTALVSFAAGYTTYHFGLRRNGQQNHGGTGGQHGLVSQRRTRPLSRSTRPRQSPSLPQGLVGDAARAFATRVTQSDCVLVA